MVGFADVPQQTPRAVTGVPPSLVTIPPLNTVVLVIEDNAVVVSMGIAYDAVPPIILVQVLPLYTCISPEVPQSLHHINNPATGNKMANFCT